MLLVKVFTKYFMSISWAKSGLEASISLGWIFGRSCFKISLNVKEERGRLKQNIKQHVKIDAKYVRKHLFGHWIKIIFNSSHSEFLFIGCALVTEYSPIFPSAIFFIVFKESKFNKHVLWPPKWNRKEQLSHPVRSPTK